MDGNGYDRRISSSHMFHDQLHAAGLEIIKTRDTSSISAPMYALTVLGFALWLAFGLLKAEWPIIITNGVCLILSAFILLMTVLPGAKKEAVADAIDPTGRGGDTSPR